MNEINVYLKIQNAHEVVGSITPTMQRALDGLVQNIAQATYNMGIQYAESKLDTTRLQYTSNLHLEKVTKSTHMIRLDPSANHLDEGYKAFDMKPGLLNGPKAKITKKGIKINTVPFRIGAQVAKTVSQYGRSALPRDFVQLWGKDYAKALSGSNINLSKIQRDPTGKPLQGKVGTVGRNKNVHPLLHGMTKYQKSYGKTTQSQYMTFRAVSSNSKPDSWQHPGFKGIHAFQEMWRFANNEVDRFIQSLKF